MHIIMGASALLTMALVMATHLPTVLVCCLVAGWAFVVLYPVFQLRLLPEGVMQYLERLTDIKEIKRMLTSFEDELEEIDLEDFQKYMKSRIIGQDDAVERITEGIVNSQMLKREKGVLFSAFLLGSTGVGKTEIARAIAEYLYNKKKPLPTESTAWFEIRCNEISQHGLSTYFGVEGGYVGHGNGGSLIRHLDRYPKSLILIDEMEKIKSDEFLNLLMTILDEGYFTNRENGRKVSMKDCVVIMTGNALALDVEGLKQRYESEQDLDRAVNKALESRFLPEFLSRIPVKLLLGKLKPLEIANVAVMKMEKMLELQEVKLKYVEPAVINMLLRQTDELIEYGVRAVVDKIKVLIQPHLVQARKDKVGEVSIHLNDSGEIDFEVLKLKKS